jgi:hypothetical protein
MKDAIGEDQFVGWRKTIGFRLTMVQFNEIIKTAFIPTNETLFHHHPYGKFEIRSGQEYNIKLLDFERVRSSLSSSLAFRLLTDAIADLKYPRETLQQILPPLITDIKDLVEQQVNMAKIKGLEEGHPKAKEVKVSLT